MYSKALLLLGLIGSASARLSFPAAATPEEAAVHNEHLDIELEVDGERQLFPLLPGTKCPTGYNCRVRNVDNIVNKSPMIGALKSSLKTPLQMSMNWHELNHNLYTVVDSSDRCTRRNAMAKAAGLIAGLGVATVSQPAYAAETVSVKMGADSGLLVFEPAKTQICKGDSVKWINNKAGPHNVVFDEDDIPSGVDQEAISMSDQLGEEGDSFTMKFDVAGSYGYYCEPHRGAGMEGKLVVV